MKLIALVMTTLLLASCATSGDFCDLADYLTVENEASANYLLENERALLKKMNVQNGQLDNCP